MTQVQGASLLAAMLFGTTLSGWLSDRFNARILLFWYYGLRGLSLIYLPYAFGIDFFGLPLFAVFYGLDWIATVSPTVRLATDVYGKEAAPIVFGWVVAGHQLGAALGGGMLRSSLGTYTVATMISGGLCLIAAVVVLRINRANRTIRSPMNTMPRSCVSCRSDGRTASARRCRSAPCRTHRIRRARARGFRAERSR